MAAARAIVFTLLVNDSMTTPSSYLMSRRACATSCHGTWPEPGRAAIVLARVQVPQPRAGGTQRVADRLLLDVHVEGVEQQPARRVPDAIDHRDGLGRQVQHARLEAVQRLDAEHDAVVGGVHRQLLQLRDEQVGVLRALVAVACQVRPTAL